MSRRTLTAIHKWLGLTLGLLIALQALTGAVLQFRDDLVRLASPAPPAAEVSALVDRAPPGSHVKRIDFDHGGRPALVHVQAPHGLEFHVPVPGAASGEVALAESGTAMLMHWVFRVHHDLLFGTVGRWVNGLLAGALLITTIIGVVLWWPGRGRLAKGLKVKWTAPPVRRWFDVHKITGLGFSVLLLATAATGVGLAYVQEMRAAMVPPIPAVAVAGRVAGDALPVDRLVSKAGAEAPGLNRRDIRFLGATGLPYRFLFHAGDAASTAPPVQIVMDPFSGAVLWRSDTADRPAVATVLDWLYPIHTQFAVGPLGRWLSAVMGVALVVLAVAGFLLWLARRRIRKKPSVRI